MGAETARRGQRLARGYEHEQGEEHDLTALESRISQYFDRHFQGTGCAGLVQEQQLNQSANLTETVEEIDRALTARWLDAASPLALSHIPEIIGALSATLRTGLNSAAPGSGTQRVSRSLKARENEWSKITPLAGLFGKKKDLWQAHTRDCIKRCTGELLEQCDALDSSFKRELVNRLSTLQIAYEAAIDHFSGLLDETDGERTRLAQELQDLVSASGANKYEFDQAALQQFIPTMLAHREHLNNASLALRNAVSAALAGLPLTALRAQTPQTVANLHEQLRTTAMERARAIHQDFESRGIANQIIGASLLRRLQSRFGGDRVRLKAEVREFVELAAANLGVKG